MGYFLHPYLSLYRWTCQRRGRLDCRASCRRNISIHQIWVSSSPVQCLSQTFSSKQQEFVYNYTKMLFIYHNYYQECIEQKQIMKKIARLHSPAKMKAASGSDFGRLVSCRSICSFPGGKGKLWPHRDVTHICWGGVSWSPEERTSQRRDALFGCHWRWRQRGEDRARSLGASQLVKA